jgi:hypothetical protein
MKNQQDQLANKQFAIASEKAFSTVFVPSMTEPIKLPISTRAVEEPLKAGEV